MSLEADALLQGRYRIVRALGRGGNADVHEAVDELLGRRVAVKVPALRLSDESSRERFRQEARAVASLSHPNVVTLFDVVEHGGQDVLVMELVEGPSLSVRLQGGRGLRVDEVVRFARDVALGLGAAHRQGLVHRDVKPGNILFDRDGEAKVADFGIAKAVASANTLTSTVHGSAHYIAPEQARGEAADPRSDLYSLGCVLFEALAGRPPFDGDTLVAVLGQHVHAQPPDLVELGVEVPEGLRVVIAGLLAKDPGDRPADAADLVAALDVVAAGGVPPWSVPSAGSADLAGLEPTVAMGSVPAPDSTMVMPAVEDSAVAAAPRRRWGWWVAGAAGLLLLASVLAGSLDRPPAELATPVDGGTPGPEAPEASSSPTPPTSSPDPDPDPEPEPEPASSTPQQVATAFRRDLAAGRQDGQVTAKVVDDLEKRLGDVLEEHEDGKDKDVAKKLSELRKELAEALEDGDLAASLHDALVAHVDELERVTA